MVLGGGYFRSFQLFPILMILFCLLVSVFFFASHSHLVLPSQLVPYDHCLLVGLLVSSFSFFPFVIHSHWPGKPLCSGWVISHDT